VLSCAAQQCAVALGFEQFTVPARGSPPAILILIERLPEQRQAQDQQTQS